MEMNVQWGYYWVGKVGDRCICVWVSFSGDVTRTASPAVMIRIAAAGTCTIKRDRSVEQPRGTHELVEER